MADSINSAVIPVVVKVQRVTVIRYNDRTNLILKLDKAVKSFKKNEETQLFEEVEKNELSLSASKAIELAETDEIAAFFMSTNGDIYSQATLGSIYFGATLVVHQTLHHKGDVVDGRDEPLDRDQWFKDVVKFTMGDFAKKMIEKKLGI